MFYVFQTSKDTLNRFKKYIRILEKILTTAEQKAVCLSSRHFSGTWLSPDSDEILIDLSKMINNAVFFKISVPVLVSHFLFLYLFTAYMQFFS